MRIVWEIMNIWLEMEMSKMRWLRSSLRRISSSFTSIYTKTTQAVEVLAELEEILVVEQVVQALLARMACPQGKKDICLTFTSSRVQSMSLWTLQSVSLKSWDRVVSVWVALQPMVWTHQLHQKSTISYKVPKISDWSRTTPYFVAISN